MRTISNIFLIVLAVELTFVVILLILNRHRQLTAQKTKRFKMEELESQLRDAHLLIAAMIQANGGVIRLSKFDMIRVMSDVVLERIDNLGSITFRIKGVKPPSVAGTGVRRPMATYVRPPCRLSVDGQLPDANWLDQETENDLNFPWSQMK